MSALQAIVMTAMEDEAAPFLERASSVGEAVQIGNSLHRRLTIADRELLLVRTGVGLVNAAGATTSAILATEDTKPPVVSAGTAGGLGVDVRVGEVILGGSYINIDADARAFGYELGQVPRMPAAYFTDPHLADAARRAVEPLADSGLATREGLIVSSYSFVGPSRVDRIREEFSGALATDMESVAIAQTCHVFGRSFISVRGISDLCGPVANSDFLTHVDDAAERSAAAVMAVLAHRE